MPSFEKLPLYQPQDAQSEPESSNGGNDEFDGDSPWSRDVHQWQRRNRWSHFARVWGAPLLVLLCSSVMLAWSLTMRFNLADKCWRMHTEPSMLGDSVDHSYHNVQFEGTLAADTKFKGKPSPEVDAEWDKYTMISPIGISEQEMVRANLSLDSVWMPKDYGDGWMVYPEFAHQLHCLNFLRKGLWWHKDYYETRSAEFQDPPDMVYTHIMHCTDLLRQALMCNADPGLISHKWVEGHPVPYPDFNTWHKCRNIDSMLETAYEKRIPAHTADIDWQPQPGEKVFTSPP